MTEARDKWMMATKLWAKLSTVEAILLEDSDDKVLVQFIRESTKQAHDLMVELRNGFKRVEVANG